MELPEVFDLDRGEASPVYIIWGCQGVRGEVAKRLGVVTAKGPGQL